MDVVTREGKKYIYDIIRKKFVALTPEEEVRQGVVHWMISSLGYPKGAISVEKAITVAGKSRRYDIVVYSAMKPWLAVECKSAGVKISQETFDQVGRYNLALRLPFLLVTNGRNNFICRVDLEKGGYEFMENMPEYPASG